MVSAEDFAEISMLKAAYFNGLDLKQWHRVREVFTDTARFEGFAFPVSDGPDDFVTAVSRTLASVQSTHQGFNLRLADHGPGRLRGIWTMHDYLTWEADSIDYKGISIPGMCGIRGYGYYEEEYLRTPSGWRIDFSRLARTRIEPIVVPSLHPDYDVVGPDADWLFAT